MSGEARRLKERLDRLIEATKELDDIPLREGGYFNATPDIIGATVLAARELRHIVRGLLEAVERGG
jgi:hypothetical protein